jgi:hypothetical protein
MPSQPLNMTPDLWSQICAAAAAYPTCTLRLRLHQGWVRGFTVEHGPVAPEDAYAPPPLPGQPASPIPPFGTKRSS